MPEPNPGESHEEFIERCMEDSESQETFPDEDQRLAFCESQWDEANESQAMSQPAYPNVCGAFFGDKWAIMPSAMNKMVHVVNAWSLGHKASAEEVEQITAQRKKPLRQVKGKVAVLPLFGVVRQRMNSLADVSMGGTSTEQFGKQFDNLMTSDDVGAIVLNVDSPGGSVYGVPELASKVFEARGQGKQIIAVANSLMASAAYWIGSAADQVIITPGGEAGSIGVLAAHTDMSEWNAKQGFNVTIVSSGKHKADFVPDKPLSEEAHADLQSAVDSYYDAFTSDVARFRDVRQSAVKGGFGEGRVLVANEALKEGLVDRIETLENVLSRLGADSGERESRRRAEDDQDRVRLWNHRQRETV